MPDLQERVSRLERALRIMLKAHEREAIQSMDPDIKYAVKSARAVLEGRPQDVAYHYKEVK